MGMPSISISFTETGSTAISRGERGIIKRCHSGKKSCGM